MATVLISRNGEQLGPYTIDAARSLVLAGTVAATDWAWIEGGTDWVPLNQLPGFAAASQEKATPQTDAELLPAPRSELSARAQAKAEVDNQSEEEQLWAGSPSQVLNLAFYLKWMLALLVIGFAAFNSRTVPLLGSAGLAAYGNFLPGIFLVALVLCAANCAWRAFQLRATHYVVTTQRVRVVRGLLSKDVQEIELFRVKDTGTHQTFFLRLFSLGNLRITSGDVSHPSLFLRAIPNPVELRERLRHEVLVLRKRFSVRELEMM